MKHFLVVYARSLGKLLEIREFDDAPTATRERHEVELRERGSPDHEVVVLTSRSEATLRTTHRRYFQTAESILCD